MKWLVIGLLILFALFSSVEIIEYFKVNCLYEKLHKEKESNEVQKILLKEFRKKVIEWNSKRIRNFINISSNDSISPFIVNENNTKAIVYYISHYKNLTTFKQVNCKYLHGKWEFTINGTLNHLFSFINSNDDSYELNFKRLLEKYSASGHIKPLSCEFNNKPFTEFRFHEMDSFKNTP